MKLSLKIRQIRSLQQRYGIGNLLRPSPEDAAKFADLDFLVDLYYEGTRGMGDEAPTMEAIEEMTIEELAEAQRELFEGKAAEGNG